MLLIPNAVDILRLGVFEVICVAISHDSRDVVVLALLLGSVGGNVESDVLRVCATC